MKNDFLKFSISIISFFILLLLCDRSLAWFEAKLYSSKDTKINYSLRCTDVADIVILGSSRANHHYVPQILTDSLHLSCVNLGEDGRGILYNYPQAHILLSKPNIPKIIIYEFFRHDWAVGVGDNILPLPLIYGKNDAVDEIIAKISPNIANCINIFQSYKYNSNIHKTLLSSKETSSSNQGWNPLYGNKKDGNEVKTLDDREQIDKYKVEVFRRFVSECKEKGIILIAVSSPIYGICSDVETTLVEKLFIKEGIPYWNYQEETYDTNLFLDNGHMNDKGALWFSSLFASKLKKYLKDQYEL